MPENVTPFVESAKDWLIRKSIMSYLRARNKFLNILRNFKKNKPVDYNDLLKLTESMEEIKDDLHLVFKRLIDPLEGKYENAAKYHPTNCELQYSNNVGLIYHKAMVAREIKYVMSHYEEDSIAYDETILSFENYLNRIELLFSQGIEILKDLMAYNRNNSLLLMFLLENSRYVESSFGESIDKLLKHVLGHNDLSEAYLRVGKFYLESGWHHKAQKMLMYARQLNPDNEEIKSLLGDEKK